MLAAAEPYFWEFAVKVWWTEVAHCEPVVKDNLSCLELAPVLSSLIRNDVTIIIVGVWAGTTSTMLLYTMYTCRTI